jgi:hypothetical protein
LDPEKFLRRKIGPKACKSLKGGSLEFLQAGFAARVLVEFIKAHRKKRQSFGRSMWLEDLRTQEARGSRRRQDLESAAKALSIDVEWRSATTVHYGYRDWVFGDKRSNFELLDFELLRVADVLARCLENLSGKPSDEVLDRTLEYWVSDVLETELLTYNRFLPLEALLQKHCAELGCNLEFIRYFESCFRQRAAADGSNIASRTGATTLYKVNKSLINCQSAHDSHTNDKRKELCGRAVSLRYEWDPKRESYCPRRGVGQLVLILDGDWSQSDVEALNRAGWDHVLYPDQLSALAGLL